MWEGRFLESHNIIVIVILVVENSSLVNKIERWGSVAGMFGEIGRGGRGKAGRGWGSGAGHEAGKLSG